MTTDIASQSLPQVGLIGITGYGSTHLRVLKSLESQGVLRISAATVINRDEVEDECQQLENDGCRIYSNYREMLFREEGSLDLCAIPTGISLHRTMTVDALKSGCHVLVEKPAAGTVAEIDEMIEASKSCERFVFVGFQDFYLDRVIEMKQQILAGRIGRVKTIRAIGSWPRPRSYYERNNWAGRIRSNGHFVYDSPANNAFAHYLMASLNFAGDQPDTVAKAQGIEAELFRLPGIESFDTISARISTDTGVDIDYAVTHKGQRVIHPTLDIIGDKGRIRWDFDRQFTIYPEGEEIESIGGDFSRESMFRKALEAIRIGRFQGCSLSMAREHTRIIEAIHQRFPIQDFSPDLIETGEIAEKPFPHVSGIEEAIEAILQDGGMISQYFPTSTSS